MNLTRATRIHGSPRGRAVDWLRLAGVVALASALAAGVAGCGTGASPATSAAASLPASSAASPAPSFPASPVDGVIVAVDATSLSDVRGFTLLLPSGATIAFRLGTLENPTEFPPGHLKEHQATSEPVRVFFRLEAGVPTVYRLGDASASSPTAT